MDLLSMGFVMGFGILGEIGRIVFRIYAKVGLEETCVLCVPAALIIIFLIGIPIC